ncbi:c-type cytochrome [Hyphococcus luteus]|uniref:Cytochrome C n=1 Tax=Hyphococcus luteus TaxID=2058213 RepID=A0A2S7K3N5_9PROT|nr:cytochrome c [Marinicaulis flavus]PQA87096.1 cytochrome C [Marinicaulis flavus]
MIAPWKTFSAGLAFLALAACGGDTEQAATDYRGDEALPGGGTVKEAIEARQSSLKEMGKAFKTISDQLKAGAPDLDAIKTSAATVAEKSAHIGTWFPEGTSAASGVETEALDTIWEKPDEFDAAVTRFEGAAPQLVAAADSGDVEAIGAAFKETGGACKNCHDTFREDDD